MYDFDWFCMYTLKYKQGPLRKILILDPKKGVWNDLPRGEPGDQRIVLDFWQLVLGGFWNQIFRYQAYDPRTASFWSLSVVKKKEPKIASK